MNKSTPWRISCNEGCATKQHLAGGAVLYKKKYGKITVSAWLNTEMERSNPFVMLTVGALLTAAGILVRILVGSPYRTILMMSVRDMMPPVWLMTVAWSLAFFTVGCAAGFVFAYRIKGSKEEKYRGSLFFVLLAVSELCWYPTVFGAHLLLIGLLECILILILSLAVTFSFYRISKFAGMLLFLHDII